MKTGNINYIKNTDFTLVHPSPQFRRILANIEWIAANFFVSPRIRAINIPGIVNACRIGNGFPICILTAFPHTSPPVRTRFLTESDVVHGNHFREKFSTNKRGYFDGNLVSAPPESLRVSGNKLTYFMRETLYE